MAFTTTRATLRESVRNRTDYRGSAYPSDAELNEYINGSIAALHDLRVEIDTSRFINTSDITIVSGTESYALPADFYKVIGHDLEDSSSQTGYVPLERFEWNDRHRVGKSTELRNARVQVRGSLLYFHPTPSAGGTLQLAYIPTAQQLADDVTTLDAFNGTELEWIILDVIIKVGLRSEDEMTRDHMQQRELVEKRLIASAEVNYSRPKQVRNIGHQRLMGRWWR